MGKTLWTAKPGCGNIEVLPEAGTSNSTMNVVREISKINDRELQLGNSNASWHDDYKDSAYIFVGGLHYDLTEGDVITIFSQYGEIMDVNIPKDKESGKSKGFAFLMYEDQRSTILAVDNLNGSKVLDRVLRVDHVRQYKQKRVKGEDGEWLEPEDQSLNAKPEYIVDDAESESSKSSGPEIDPEDPMAAYLLEKRKAEKAKKKSKSVRHKGETPEERRARKERKKEKRLRKLRGKSLGLEGVQNILRRLGGGRDDNSLRHRSRSSSRNRPQDDHRYSDRRNRRTRSKSPVEEPGRYSHNTEGSKSYRSQ